MTRLAMVFGIGVLFSMVVGQATADPAKGLSPKVNGKIDPRVLEPLNNRKAILDVLQKPDLAAQKIDFRISSRTSPSTGTVEIIGTVGNVGQADFVSGRGQQEVQLYENGRLIAQLPFERLNRGAELQVRFTRSWNTTTFSRPSTTPVYKLYVVYDPDILNDGNPNNDDVNHRNNFFERSGADINAMFR